MEYTDKQYESNKVEQLKKQVNKVVQINRMTRFDPIKFDHKQDME